MELKDKQFIREFGIQTDFQLAENKELVFSVADEVPYLRHDETFGDYYLVLEISEDAIDTTRLVKNMPFLKDHERTSQLGAVKRFWLKDKKLYVSVKFSRSKFAQAIKDDIIDLIRQNTSVGYYVNLFKREGEIDGIPVLRAVSWTPYECSSVSVPASVWVGYNRSIEIKLKGLDLMNALTDKTDTTPELANEKLEGKEKETDVELENKDLAGEDLESKSKEDGEVAEEDKEKETKAGVCPDCGKDPCECEEKKEKACGGEMKPLEKSLEPTKDAIAEALAKQAEADATEIRSLGELTGEFESALEFISKKRTLNLFKTYIKNKRSGKSKNSILDKNKMNRQYFSISKAIRNACSQYKADVSEEYETQVITNNKRDLNINDADIVLSNKEVRQRGVLTGGLTQSPNPNFEAGTDVGNALIATDYLPQEYVSYLRPQLTLEKTGYYSIPVNGNSVSFAVCTSGSVAKMYNLDGELEDGVLKFSTKTLVPHKAGVCVPINYSMLLQARPEIDALVENDIVNALYQLRDEQILIGQGTVPSSNLYECLGILNTPDINQITGTVSGEWSYADFLQAENQIRKANIFSENISIVMNGDDYVKVCSTPKSAGNMVAGFICENDKIKNFNVYVNNSIPTGVILMGDFGEVAVADFEGLKLKVDDITYIKQGAIQIVATKAFDCVCRRPKAFTKITMK